MAHLYLTIVFLNVPLSDYYTDASDGDFTEARPSQTFKIPRGQSSGQITVATTDDDICEGTETFKVYLKSIDGGILGNVAGSDCCATVTITDNDGKAFV